MHPEFSRKLKQKKIMLILSIIPSELFSITCFIERVNFDINFDIRIKSSISKRNSLIEDSKPITVVQ